MNVAEKRETFRQWEDRMRLLNDRRVIHTELNDAGGVVRAWCDIGQWEAGE